MDKKNNNLNWRPIFKGCSLPYNEGDRFLVRRNQCICDTEEINIIKCLKTEPCIEDLVTLNELSFTEINVKNGRRYKSVSYSKECIIRKYKYWKLLQLELDKRQDVFVCRCINTCILYSIKDDSKNDYTKLTCCHCKELVMKCSKDCINAQRGNG